jgi:uncharacterized protein (TIGR02001 family)
VRWNTGIRRDETRYTPNVNEDIDRRPETAVFLRIAAVVTLGFSLPSLGQDRFGGSLAVTSDYVYRGVTQTYGRPAVQADLHYAATAGWSVGLWGSTIELNRWDGRTVELDAYAGYRWQLSDDWSAKTSVVHYDYPWNGSRVRYDYNELVGSIGFRNRAFLTVAWSFDASRYSTRGYVTDGNSIAYDAALSLPLRYSLTANFGLGYYDLRRLIDTGYAYWNIGLGFDRFPWRLDVSYIGTHASAVDLFYGRVAGDRLAASALWRF